MREPLAPGIAAPGVAVADPRWSPAGSRLVWLRTAPDGAELVVAPTDGSGPPLTIRPDPAPERVRATGGGVLAWAGEDRLLYVAADGRLCSLRLPDGDPSPGPAAVVAATDGTISAPAVAPGAGLVAFVVEAADWCAVTVAPLDGDGAPVRRSTADWAWDPAWSPDGLLAWQEWDFPAMPWDGSRVVVVDGTDPGARPRSLAGGAGVAVGQPRFAPDGRLAYVSDEHGWWNVWVEPAPGRGPTRERRPLLEEPFEHADPGWEAGQRSYAWSPGGDAVALCRNEDGFGRLVVVDRDGRARALRRGWHHGLDWGPGGIAAVRSGARTAPAVTVTDATGGSPVALDAPLPTGLDPGRLREPEPVTWPGADGATVHGLLWHPGPGDGFGGAGRALIVDVHGGPTGQATVAWNLRTQYLVSRGWAVLQPNPRGSTGYGRAYRQALAACWGELDVDDVAAGIRAAGARGWCDPTRVAVVGGSSGGMLALLLCARYESLARAAVVSYPVTDLLDLAATTHRFESHYSDGLVGELPGAAGRYRARSPVSHADRIRTPLLVLQGDADVVVRPEQVDRFVRAVRAAGGTVDAHRYPGEGHGWSRRETVLDALARTEAFLVRHLGEP